ncbi:sugar kinase [Consotaella aegiceratis]|uniref:sugar kinase n=1 Tax=Consotaella aegiceratis TaxID=3097961 RepID=UPI002F42F9FD
MSDQNRTASAEHRIVAIGECMVELSSAPGGLLRKGFAGDTFNTAWYLGRALPADWRMSYFTAVGDDPTSDEMLRFMDAAGIETQFVRRIPGRMPGLYLITLDNGERSFSYWRDTSAAKTLADDEQALDAVLAAGDAFYFSGITLAILAEDARQRLVSRLDEVRRSGKMVAFDPNLRPRLWPDTATMCRAVEIAAAASSLCLPSFSDEAVAFGDASPDATADRYRALGVAEVVVKDGAEPACIVTDDGRQSVPAQKVADLVDTTAAGDSFNAAYIAARLAGKTPAEAAAAGHTLAGKVVGHYGALVEL